MIRRLTPRFVLVLILLMPNVLFGQSQVLGRIVGTIRVGRGEFPTRQIMVELYLRGAPTDSTYTDGQGVFSFYNLIPNGYRIVIRDEAYYPIDEAANVDPNSSSTTTLHLVLRPREATNNDDPMGARASGSNPYLVGPADYNKRFPKRAVKEYERGVAAEHNGKPDEAMAHYLDALKIAPGYYPAHNNLGSLYLSKADFKSAEQQFQEAARLDQNDAQAYFNLGNVFMLTGRYPDSASALSSGFQRRPDSAFGHFLQGCLSSRTGDYPQAEKSLRQALRLDSTMWQAHLQLVNLFLVQHQPQSAIEQLQTFLQTFPSAPAVPKAKELLQKLQAGARQ